MRRLWILLCFALVMVAVHDVGPAGAEDDSMSGRWDLTLRLSNGRQLKAGLEVESTSDGGSGCFIGREGARFKLESSTANAGRLSAKWTAPTSDRKVQCHLIAEVQNDNRLLGRIDYVIEDERGQIDVTGTPRSALGSMTNDLPEPASNATPIKAAPAEPTSLTGRWDITIDGGGEQYKYVLAIDRTDSKFSAKLRDENNTRWIVESVDIQPTRVLLTARGELGGRALTTVFNGEVVGDRIAGIASVAAGGSETEFDFVASRR